MMIAPIIFALLLGAFIFVILPHAGVARRILSVGIFLMLITVVYVGASELLGRPKPLGLEWRDVKQAEVLSGVPVENEAIYLWLTAPGSSEPRAYVLPWSQRAAQQLQDATGKAEADGTAVEMAMPSEAGLDTGRPMFYAKPQPALPVKDYRSPAASPLVYTQPGQAADAAP